jgi:hypothetical protein
MDGTPAAAEPTTDAPTAAPVTDAPTAGAVVNTDSGTMEMQRLSASQARCLDGTAAGFYHNLNPESTTWVMHMKGGGSCASEADCEKREIDSPHLTGSSTWNPTKNGSEFYSRNCAANPEFCEANHIYIPYCSSDGHRGQMTTAAWGKYWFTGHTNFKKIIDKLLNGSQYGTLQNAERVLLTGCSGGGSGVWTNADTLAALLPHASVKAAPRGAWFWNGYASDQPEENWWISTTGYNDFTDGNANTPADMDAVLTGLVDNWCDPYLQPGCVAAHTADTKQRCYSATVFARHITTPVILGVNMFESKMMDGRMLPDDDASKKAYQAYFADAMVASTQHWLQLTPEGQNALFMPACYAHCDNVGLGDAARIEGHNYEEVLADWFYERNTIPHQLVDDCGDGPCNPACPLDADDDSSQNFLDV